MAKFDTVISNHSVFALKLVECLLSVQCQLAITHESSIKLNLIVKRKHSKLGGRLHTMPVQYRTQELQSRFFITVHDV